MFVHICARFTPFRTSCLNLAFLLPTPSPARSLDYRLMITLVLQGVHCTRTQRQLTGQTDSPRLSAWDEAWCIDGANTSQHA